MHCKRRVKKSNEEDLIFAFNRRDTCDDLFTSRETLRRSRPRSRFTSDKIIFIPIESEHRASKMRT